MSDTGLDAMRMHSRDEFEAWLARDVEVRDELIELIGDDPGLDAASLDRVEDFLLRRYRNADAALRLDERGVLDAAARQTGLVLVLGTGGVWDIDLTYPDDAYYRLPVVQPPDGPPECPLSLVTAALERRSGDYLSTVAGNLIEEYSD